MTKKKTFQISGKIARQNIGTGFWGIIGDNGEEWLPVNLPSQYQVQDKRVTLQVKLVEGGVSIFMWGTMVEIV